MSRRRTSRCRLTVEFVGDPERVNAAYDQITTAVRIASVEHGLAVSYPEPTTITAVARPRKTNVPTSTGTETA